MAKFHKYCFLLIMLIPFGAYAEHYRNDLVLYDYNPDYPWYNSNYSKISYGLFYYNLTVNIDNYSVTKDTAKVTNGKVLVVDANLQDNYYWIRNFGTQHNYNALITVIANTPGQNSEDVVFWVRDQLEASGIAWKKVNMLTSASGDKKPQKLKFAVKVDLTITSTRNNIVYTCKNVILGQGHYLFNNNWWIFSNVDNSKDNRTPYTLKCDGGDIGLMAEGNNKFRLLIN